MGEETAELAEYKELMQLVGNVEKAAKDAPTGEPSWAGTLTSALEELDARLTAHYSSEERAPIYTELPAAYPRFARLLRILKDEHAQIRLHIAKLLSDLHGGANDSASFSHQARQVVDMVRRHEQAELDVMQRVVNEDIGAGD